MIPISSFQVFKRRDGTLGLQVSTRRYDLAAAIADRARLLLAALEQEKELYESLPENPEIDAWCADLTEDLSGAVGTIEIGGQLETGKVLIRPGYDGIDSFCGLSADRHVAC